MGDEGIEPLGIHRNFLSRLFYKQTCGTSPKVRLERFELSRPKAHALRRGASSQLRHSRIDSAGPIRTDKRESLRLAAFPISVTAPQVAGE
jgi:hypothetical protein